MKKSKLDKYYEELAEHLKDLEKQLEETEHTHERWPLEDKIRDIRIELLPNDKKFFTEYLYSDAHAYEIIEQRTPDMYIVRRLNAEITEEASKALKESFIPGGFCGHFDNSLQEWTFSSNEKNPLITIRRHKNGKFYAPNTRTCPFIMHDAPYEHYDYNF